jgi:hypothetical protein
VIEQCVAVLGHLFIGERCAAQRGFALSTAVHGDHPVVAREFADLPLETRDRFAIAMDQQQWRTLAVGLVVKLRAPELEARARRRIAAIANFESRRRCRGGPRPGVRGGTGRAAAHQGDQGSRSGQDCER